MISQYRKVITLKVVPHLPDAPFNGQTFFLGRGIISLSGRQRAASVCYHPLFSVVWLSQHSTQLVVTGIGLQDGGLGEVRANQDGGLGKAEFYFFKRSLPISPPPPYPFYLFP